MCKKYSLRKLQKLYTIQYVCCAETKTEDITSVGVYTDTGRWMEGGIGGLHLCIDPIALRRSMPMEAVFGGGGGLLFPIDIKIPGRA